MSYTVDYFIEKFEAIPEDKWTTGKFYDGDKFCALGHCGHTEGCITEEGCSLWDLLFKRLDRLIVAQVNDGIDPNYQQPTPKQRILAALYDIKKIQS